MANVADFRALIEGINWNDFAADLLAWGTDFVYQGLDPIYIATKVMQYMDTATLTDAQKKSTIAMCIYLYMERGNKVSAMITKSTPTGKTKIINLQRMLHLEDGSENNRKEAVTLSRIALCFPLVTLKYVGIAKNLTFTEAEMKAKTTFDYPKVMCSSAFASVIPRTIAPAERDKLRHALLGYQMELSFRLKKGNFLMNNANALQALVFIDNGVNSDLVDEQERLDFVHAQGLLSANTAAGLVIGSIASTAQWVVTKYGL